MKPQAHRDAMLRRKAERAQRTLRAQCPGLPELELRARAISEVSGVPVEQCRDQLQYWATGKRPEVSQWELCAFPRCDLKASKMASSHGTPFCWHHAGEWTQSPEAQAWRAQGATMETKAPAVAAFIQGAG